MSNAVPQKRERGEIGKIAVIKVQHLLKKQGIFTKEVKNIKEDSIMGDLEVIKGGYLRKGKKGKKMIFIPTGSHIEVKWTSNTTEGAFIKHKSSINGTYGKKDYPSGISISKSDFWIHIKYDEAYLLFTSEVRDRHSKSNDVRNSTQEGKNSSPDNGKIIPLYPDDRCECLDFEQEFARDLWTMKRGIK